MTKKILGLSILFSFLALTLATPASAQSAENVERRANKRVDLVCMQNTIQTRETGIFSAFDAYTISMKASYTKRQNGLIAAWKIETKTERIAAVKNVWQTFKTEHKSAKDTYQAKKKELWKTFRTERKTCGSQAVAEDNTAPVVVNE